MSTVAAPASPSTAVASINADIPHLVIVNGRAAPRTVKKKDGTSMIFNEQRAAIVKPDRDFPEPFTINLQEGQDPFPPGKYLLSCEALDVGDFDSLRVARRIRLIPFSQLGLK
ncbi:MULTISPECIES: single-stranded DNA-binding protein [Luteimonas]|uniref:single-stranded DNA-binding protein n=1 Tax=Luteimonas TaxID=83614 RepID=UPI0013043718|nr:MULTISPECIES: single-stranded DNA-binding protein [Luteimonas]